MPDRKTYLGMRSNADGMTFGASTDLERRVKLASLLSDEVILERGALALIHRPGGILQESRWRGDQRERWLTAEERRRAYVAPDGTIVFEPERGAPAPQYPDATELELVSFEPLLRSLPPGIDWIDVSVDDVEALSRGLQAAPTEADQDRIRAAFRGELASLGPAARDLVLGAGMGAVTTMGHRRTYEARVALDEMRPTKVAGLPVLDFAVPNIQLLDWDDIARWRRHRTLEKLRDVMSEIEANAYVDSDSFETFTDAAHRGVAIRALEEASSDVVMATGETGVAFFSQVLGVLIPPLGLVQAAGSSVGPLVNHWRDGATWRAGLLGLRADVQRRIPVGRPRLRSIG